MPEGPATIKIEAEGYKTQIQILDVTANKYGRYFKRFDMEKAEAAEIAPFYLLNGLTLKHDIKKGEPVTKDAVDLGDGVYVDLYEKGLAL